MPDPAAAVASEVPGFPGRCSGAVDQTSAGRGDTAGEAGSTRERQDGEYGR